MLKLIAILAAAVAVAATAMGQSLPETPFLGVQARPLNATLAEKRSLTDTVGLYIVEVYPGNTADRLGVEAGDVLLKADSRPTPDVASLQAALAEADGTLGLVLRRNGRELRLRGTLLARMPVLSEGVELRKGAVPFRKGLIRSFVYEPQAADARSPTVFILQGYPCRPQLNAPDWHSYHQLSNHLARRGYRVFRMEKPGMGDSRGGPECRDIDFDTEVAAFAAGLQSLRGRPDLDTNRIFLLGHSLGGLTAPLLAAQQPVAGVMVYGITYRPWLDYLLANFRRQPVWFGADAAEAFAQVEAARPMLTAYLDEALDPRRLTERFPEQTDFLRRHLRYDGSDQIMQRHWSFWPDVQSRNWPAIWHEVDAPMLAVYGDADIAALDGRSCRELVDALNARKAGSATYVEAPDANHHMLDIDRARNIDIQLTEAYREYSREHFSERVVTVFDRWMRAQLEAR